MAIEAGQSVGSRGANPWRIIGWGLAAALLVTPFVAMQFTREVNWNAADFIVAGLMFGTVGLLFELAVRMSPNRWYRGGAAAALGASFLTFWINGAVGMIGDDNPYNFLFLAVILVAVGGAILVRFRAAGLANVMALAAVLHGAVAIGGFGMDPRGAVFSLLFALPWLGSAALFRQAARTG